MNEHCRRRYLQIAKNSYQYRLNYLYSFDFFAYSMPEISTVVKVLYHFLRCIRILRLEKDMTSQGAMRIFSCTRITLINNNNNTCHVHTERVGELFHVYL